MAIAELQHQEMYLRNKQSQDHKIINLSPITTRAPLISLF